MLHWAAAVLLLLSAPAAQEKLKACVQCDATGRKPCPEHAESECEMEDEVLFCSVVEGCAVCGGAGFVPCPFCKDDAARLALEERRARIRSRKPLLQPIDDRMGRPLRKAETDHFVFVWEMDKYKIDKRWATPHEGMHVYAARLERLFDDYCARFETKAEEFAEKSWIFVWYLPEDHREGSMRFCSQSAEGGVKLMGAPSRYSVCGNKQNFQGDAELNRNLVHCVTHLLLSHQRPTAWIGNLKAGWADEGIAHWFEDRHGGGICDNYCYQEANTMIDFKSGKWRLALRRMVTEGRVPPIAEVLQQNSDTLTPAMNAAAFGYVDFLITRDGAKLLEVVRKLKAKVPSREALQQVYGYGPIDLEAQWKAWALATYPTR